MPEDEPIRVPALRRRLLWSVGVALGAVVAAGLLVPSHGQSGRTAAGLLQKEHSRSARAAQQAAAEARPPRPPAGTATGTAMTAGLDGHAHDHDDPATKNAISRTTGDVATADTQDPTTPVQAAIGTAT